MMKSNSMFSVFVVVILSVLFSGFIVQPQAQKSVELKKRIQVMTDELEFVKFVPDKQQILAGPVAPRADIVAGLYRISDGKRLDTFPVREKNPEGGIALSRDGTLLASTEDGKLKVWKVQNGETLFSSEPLSWAPPVSFNPEGNKLAFGYCLKKEGQDCAESEVRVLNLGNGEISTLAAETMEDLHSLLWGEGGLLAYGLTEINKNNVIKIIDIESGELKATFKSNYGRAGKMVADPPEMVFGNEGNFFAATSIAGPSFTVGSRTLRFWDPILGKKIKDLKTSTIAAMDFYQLKNLLVTVSPKSVSFWDLKKSVKLQSFTPNEEGVNDVALSSDGELLATCYDDTIKIWDLKIRFEKEGSN